MSTENPSSGPTWRHVLYLVLGVTVARIVWLIFLSPYELTYDEAQYWEWSRRLSLSYYSKGPGIAWTIAAFTRTLGHSEWTVRLASPLFSMIGALAVGRLALNITRGSHRAALYAVACFLLIPIYQIMALGMSIDGPLLACWAVSLWAAWHLFDNLEHQRDRLAPWLALSLALGVGFLFKYTMALLIPGLILHAILRTRHLHASRQTLLRLLTALMLLLLCISPVIIWNHQHDWPTTRHLLGHLGVSGGDVPPQRVQSWYAPVLWVLDFWGAQLLAIGPMLALFIMAARRVFKERWQHGEHWPGRLLLLNSAWPILLFYLLTALMHRTEGNWPIAAYVGLTALAGEYLALEMPRRAGLVREWFALPKPRPRRGILLRRPETAWQFAWHWALGFGIGTAVILASMPALAHVPVLGRLVPISRVTGWRQNAVIVEEQARLIEKRTGVRPWIAAANYGTASQLAFYMPPHADGSHWIVHSASAYLNGRPSSHDFFADIDLRSPDLHDRPALFLDYESDLWRQRFIFQRITEIATLAPRTPGGETLKLYLATGYRGPREPR